MATALPLVLFDGHCALCSGFVQRLLEADEQGVLRFAPLQSAFAKTRLDAAKVDTEGLDSVVFIDAAREAHVKSDAFFAIMRAIGGAYRYLGVLQVLPKGLRNGVYDLVARYRYRVFGQHEACWLPKPEWRGRFLGE